MWFEFLDSSLGPLLGSCEHGSETSGFVKLEIYLLAEWLLDSHYLPEREFSRWTVYLELTYTQ
jgi:hypothetical protein